jgi:electron transfer flavoprotein beta subunit
VVALEAPEVDDALFTALAKGADRAVKVLDGDGVHGTRAGAHRLAEALISAPGLLPADLILTGVQAIDDLDGLTAPLLARQLGLPYIGIVSQIEVDPSATRATVVKEFPGGVRGAYVVAPPAVLGIQAAEKPPRYVPVAKVRASMKSTRIETLAAAPGAEAGVPPVAVLRMAKPESAEHAEMLTGSPDDVAGKVVEILSARGLL